LSYQSIKSLNYQVSPDIEICDNVTELAFQVISQCPQTQQQQTANTLLLIHLGAVEATVCLILLIFATGLWPLTGTWCVLYGFLLALLHPVALWTVTGLNCDR